MGLAGRYGVFTGHISDTSTSDDALALYRYKGTLAPAESESDDDDHKDIKVFLVDTVDAHKSLKPEGGMGEGGDSGVLGK